MVYTKRSEKMQTAKLFKNGRSQAVRLPKEFRMEGDRVGIKKVSNTIVLIPLDDPWKPLFDSLDKFSDEFMNDREQPTEQQEREEIFP
jgi:antitoxin VapB